MTQQELGFFGLLSLPPEPRDLDKGYEVDN